MINATTPTIDIALATRNDMHLPVHEQNELLTAAQAGDEAAFGILVSHYRDYAVSLARRKLGAFAYEAEDVVQDSLVAVWRNIGRVEGYFWKYLEASILRRVMNKTRDLIKKKTDYYEDIDDDLAHADPNARESQSPEQLALQAERAELARQLIASAVSRMSPRYAKAFMMKEMGSASYDDIAKEFGFASRGRAKSFCNTARLAFRNACLDADSETTDALGITVTAVSVPDDESDLPAAGETLSLF